MDEKLLKWQIYVLRCPKTNEVRYVGWTSIGIQNRLKHHIHEAGCYNKTHKQKWIRKLLREDLKPLIEAIQDGSGPNWEQVERKWIAIYKNNGCRLVNGTVGGDGVIGWGTPEQRSEVARLTQLNRDPAKKKSSSVKRLNTIRTKLAQGIPVRTRSFTAAQKIESANRAKKSWAKTTKEQRLTREIKRQTSLTPETKKLMIEKRKLSYPTSRRSSAARDWQAAKTPEQRSAAAKSAYQTFLKRRREKTVEQQVPVHDSVVPATSAVHDPAVEQPIRSDEHDPASAAVMPSDPPVA